MNTFWTNDESARTKLWIESKGYYCDPFLKSFCTKPMKRTPEINRGYYARCMAVTRQVEHFCMREGATAAAQDCCTIVNIGCGYDTLYWRLKTHATLTFTGRVVDVDTHHVISNKIRLIERSQHLRQHLLECDRQQRGADGSTTTTTTTTTIAAAELHSKQYHAIGCDATNYTSLLHTLMTHCAVSATAPVLFLFECVLLYWSGEQTHALLSALSAHFARIHFLVFDLVNTEDEFARVMQRSLQERDTPLLGVNSCTQLDDWRSRFVAIGCTEVDTWDMKTVYENVLPRADIERIERLEFLDERELLSQLLAHYCLVLAKKLL